MSFKDHFSTQAAIYAQARPTYPAAWFTELARLAPGHELAWDAGAGNGQASTGLAAHFAQVIATEPSAAQLAEAAPHPKVNYHQSAETAPMIADGSVDLVTVAQAVHWFDRPNFYAEVRRVLRPGGVVALWAYELGIISPEINAAVLRFYKGTDQHLLATGAQPLRDRLPGIRISLHGDRVAKCGHGTRLDAGAARDLFAHLVGRGPIQQGSGL